MPTPSSWESSLSSYSLENSLAEGSHLISAPEPREKLARKLKSESSFACSDFDSSLQGSLCQDPCKDETITQGTANQAGNKHAPSAKASLADRCETDHFDLVERFGVCFGCIFRPLSLVKEPREAAAFQTATEGETFSLCGPLHG